MTDVAVEAWACPKDGTEMASVGRRSGAWRCPACKAVFLDVEAMRRGRRDTPPAWAPVVMSVAMSLLATFLVRRLLRRAGRLSPG
jgi:tRNA(Ile2) C34 agmatinyltransferase TiaS